MGSRLPRARLMGDPLRTGARWAALVVFVLTVATLAASPLLRPAPTAREIRRQLLAELRPVVLENCAMQRFGGPNDGGYLMCGNLLGGVESAYSYGIGPADDWGCDVSGSAGVPVHQYDCFNPPEQACPGGRSIFHDECIGPRPERIKSRAFDTLTGQIFRNGDAGKTLVVKIDIEGAEVESLLATPDRVLDRIVQMPMEIHGTSVKHVELLRKLKRTFHLVHLHFNNQGCSVRWAPLPSWAYQVLFVNKRLGVPAAGMPTATLPHPLDAPDYAFGHDCQLGMPVELWHPRR